VGELVGAPAVAPLGGHALDDVDEGVQPGADGLQAAQALVELLHGGSLPPPLLKLPRKVGSRP
jgi:hypothetical protein